MKELKRLREFRNCLRIVGKNCATERKVKQLPSRCRDKH